VPEQPERYGRHRFDLATLIAGLFFLAIAVTHLAKSGLRWQITGPAVLVGLGIVGIILASTRRRRRQP
jgi:hypothetical protein